MRKVRINLRRADKYGRQKLMAKVDKHNISIEIPIRTVGMDNIYVPSKIWDVSNANVHTTATAYNKLTKAERQDLSLIDLEVYHRRIDDIKTIIGTYLRDTDTRQYTKEQLRGDLYALLGYADDSNNKRLPTTIHSYIEDYIHRCEADNNKSKGTLSQYRQLLSVFEAKYQTTKFSDIDKSWEQEFKVFIRNSQSFRYTYRGEERLYEREDKSVGTANNLIKNLKVILRDAYKQGITSTDISLLIDKIKTVNIARDTDYYLTLNQINSLHTYTPIDDIDNDGGKVSAQTLTVAKDLFLLCCTLGQRVSDIECGISPEQIKVQDGIRYVEILQSKTGKYITALLDIPIIGDIAGQIVDRYSNNVPSMRGQRINEYIKIVARQIGGDFSRTHKYQTEKNGTIYDHETPIHDLVSTHDGRRSFVSIFVDAGYSWEQISMMTGHSSKDMVQLYTKISTAKQTINAFKQ